MKQPLLLLTAMFIAITTFAQDSTFQQMLDYSRPGKYHKVLESLEGSWTYKGGHPDSSGKINNYYIGNFTWKAFAGGRFFIADLTSSKIQMPVQDGKFKEENYHAIWTIGYNNVQKKFEESVIGNMLGSNITFARGNYDSVTHTITFDYEDEPLPNMKQKLRDEFVFIDAKHYVINSYDEENGKYIANNKVECTRIEEK